MGSTYNQHFVCTLDEARKLVEEHDQFYVSNCGCRESKGTCKRSKIEVCLYFNDEFGATGTGKRAISRDEVYDILTEAKTKHLVPRPFRSETDKNMLDGICFCCDDCCYYFTAHEEECDKGAFIENTILENCINCGNCVDVCYFKAREINNDSLEIDRYKCYGCGLCVDVCPTNCISMIAK